VPHPLDETISDLLHRVDDRISVLAGKRIEEEAVHRSNPLARIVLCSDTRPTRFLLGWAAMAWAVGLASPGDTLARSGYHYLLSIAPEPVWSAIWAAYALAMFASAFFQLPRKASLALNTFGLAIWSFTTLSMAFVRLVPFPAALAGDIALCFAALWVMMRTDVSMGRRSGD
jgi:hypothetical protein